MAKAYGYIIVYNNNGDIVYKHKGSGGDYGGTVSLNNNIVTISSDYAPQVEPIDDSDPEFPDRWSTVIDTGEVNVSNLTNPTSLQIVLPYKASKIRYFGGSSGSFADSNGSGYSAAIINNGETITLASNNYDTGGGCAIQYYEEAAPKVSVDLTTLPGWSSLSTGSHNITIVAKADGYRDSEPSSAVSVTKGPQEYTDCITFTGESSDFTLAVGSDGAKEWDGTVEYSTDHNTWTTWDGTEISSSGQKLYLRGSGNTTFYTSKGARFVLSAKVACSGNLNTLLEYSNPPTTLASSCYKNIFYGCTSLTTAPALPATTLADYCYSAMFRGCKSLTTAPELPATTLATSCYSLMFYGCTSLTRAPELPATTLASNCYQYMFFNCMNLTAAPELPATTLGTYCYYSMFYHCTRLTQAPALPATTLADYCYQGMFYDCTRLTQAPELPATILADYCYQSMFQRCANLTQAPALPATTLADYCYQGMFSGCTSLTQAPELPATTLGTYCYRQMFSSCTSLKISATQSSDYPTAWRIPSSGTISSTAAGWNSNMLSGTGGTFTSNPSINTTYYGAWTK